MSKEISSLQHFVQQWLHPPEPCTQIMADISVWHENWWSAVAPEIQVYAPPTQSWLQRWLWGVPAHRIVEQTKSSLLILQQPRWPLTHILFIVRAEESDWTAFTWLERLAQPQQTTVTLLPIVPPWPRFHRISDDAQPTPEVLLAPNTVSGAMLRQMALRLHQRQIAASFALDRGEPAERIRAVVATDLPQLIVIAAESHHWLLRRLYGELVKPLVNWAPCPLLITK